MLSSDNKSMIFTQPVCNVFYKTSTGKRNKGGWPCKNNDYCAKLICQSSWILINYC